MARRRPFGSRHEQYAETETLARRQPASTSRDIEHEIATANARAEALRSEMGDALTVWLDAAAPWAAAFWEGAITTSVVERPEVVVEIDDDHRHAVKQQAAELIANARAHIERRLVSGRPEDWPHLKPQTDPYDPAFRRDAMHAPFDTLGPSADDPAPEVLAGRMNGVLGDIASISDRQGFTLSGFAPGDPFGHTGSWHPDRGHRPRWSQEMLAAIETYASLHQRYVAVLAEKEGLEGEQRRITAMRLWETS